MKIRQKVQVAAMVLGCVLLDVVLHVVTSSYSTMPENPSLSSVSSILGTELTASLWALFAFSCVAFVYLHVRNQIPGAGVKKGLRYGTAIALLWLLAMLEGVSLFGNPFVKELVVGLSDAIPVFLLGILLSILPTERVKGDRPVEPMLRQRVATVLAFAAIFLTGRYLAYFSGVIQSGAQTRPLQTFTWTILMGASIGVAFVLLCNNGNEQLPKHAAARFGFLVFGLNWAAFLVFMPLLLSGYMADVCLRVIIDTTLVMIASCWAVISGGVPRSVCEIALRR